MSTGCTEVAVETTQRGWHERGISGDAGYAGHQFLWCVFPLPQVVGTGNGDRTGYSAGEPTVGVRKRGGFVESAGTARGIGEYARMVWNRGQL